MPAHDERADEEQGGRVSRAADATSSGSGSLEECVRRVVRSTGMAASSGAVLGTVLALRSPSRGLRQLMASSATSAASLGMLGLSFAAAKEYTRTLTGSQSPINSAVGGAAAGGLLFASHSGNPVLGAAIGVVLATAADIALSSVGGSEGADGAVRGADDDAEGSWWSLSRWVRKTSEEERLEFLEKRRRRIARED